jgi:hypothetical protein
MARKFSLLAQVIMRQEPSDVLYFVLARVDWEHAAADHEVISDYFNLGIRLADLVNDWSKRDKRFRDVSPYFPGANPELPLPDCTTALLPLPSHCRQ